MQFQTLCKILGIPENPTVQQYAFVLEHLAKQIDKLRSARELVMVSKVTQHLMNSLKNAKYQDIRIMHLLSESGQLLPSSEQVCNDAPSFHERANKLDLHFLMDLTECGIRRYDAEELLNTFPRI